MWTVKPATARIASLDQFRGYTITGMFLVNFIGSFAVTPIIFTHQNTFCSFADTIMPQFFFAVGFAFRLSFGRRAHSNGLGAAYGHVVRRLLGLALLSLVFDPVGRRASTWAELVAKGPWGAIRDPLKEDFFGTLMHIALTSLWILPVIRARAAVRIGFMLASATLQLLLSHWFYFEMVHQGGVDGGPFGFLAWTVPTIMGTLACDAVLSASGRPRLVGMFFWSAVLMGAGYLLSCGTRLYDVPEDQIASAKNHVRATDAVLPSRERLEAHAIDWAEPPFVPPPDSDHRKHNYWMMSQRAATLSYQLFGAGFSLAVYGLFYIACDTWGWQSGLFRTLGTNALIGYILHGFVASAVKPFVPPDSPPWYVTAGFLVYFGITYLFIRHLEKNQIYLKL